MTIRIAVIYCVWNEINLLSLIGIFFIGVLVQCAPRRTIIFHHFFFFFSLFSNRYDEPKDDEQRFDIRKFLQARTESRKELSRLLYSSLISNNFCSRQTKFRLDAFR